MLLLRVVSPPDESDRRTFAERASFRGARPVSARLPAGPGDDLRVFWLRACGIDPRSRLSTQFSWLPGRLLQNGSHRKGLPGGRYINEQRLPRITEYKSR